MVNMLHRKIRVNEVSKVVTSTQDKKDKKMPKKFGDVELQALSNEDDSQTQKQLAQQLGVSQQAVSKLLQVMGTIQKTGMWAPHELNDRQMEKGKNT